MIRRAKLESFFEYIGNTFEKIFVFALSDIFYIILVVDHKNGRGE